MTINLQVPSRHDNLKPTITVVGVGGAGGNAVNNMITSELEGVSFVVGNTDAQALDNALTDRVVQLGANVTQGLGAGANPDVGRASAEEALDELMAHIDGSHMVFITAGMGGGTGTGAAPVVARMAKEQGILTVAVVTKPFHFEGSHRMKLAESGLEELQKYVDTMIVIPNQNLFRVANEKTTFADAFCMADEVLHSGVRGVTDLMVMPGLINLDFSDIRTVMREMGKAMMGTGEAEGERRAIDAAEAAISNPLLDDVSMKGARGVLINITGGPDMTLFEVDEAANRIRDEVDPDANIIFGSTFNDAMEGKMRVSVVATGIEQPQAQRVQPPKHGSTAGPSGVMGFNQRSASRNGGSEVAKAPAAAPSAVTSSFAGSNRFAVKEMVSREELPVVEEKPAPATTDMADDEQDGFAFAHEEVPVNPPVAKISVGRHSPTRMEATRTVTTAEPNMPAEPSFSAPATPEPVASAPAQPMVRDEVQPGLWEEADEAPAKAEEGGLIRRMSSRFSGGEEAAPRRAEVTQARPAPETESDYLEIPAFLRRQAN